jgi:predicted secreted Zn-dependent protease
MPKQKLSLKARAAKKKRDLKVANSPRRKAMRAENQRKRRAAIKAGKNIKGKDYDHKTKRFTSIKANRGNRGHGTKKE